MTLVSSEEVAEAAVLACLLEVAAPKPGNVTLSRALPGLTPADFLASAAAVGPVLSAAGDQGVGTTILRAITATRRRVATNTNLGIVLLLAPLAAAALRPSGQGASLRGHVEAVLEALTVEDTRQAYRAIRLAMPGGLGQVAEQDVAADPTVGLREAMALAATRDAVAREYATGFNTTFGTVVPALRRYVAEGQDGLTAIVGAYLEVLAGQEDSLIARRHGARAATEVTRRAGKVLEAGGPGAGGVTALAAFDAWLRSARPPLNPGTSADLVTAALFVALLEGLHLVEAGRTGTVEERDGG